MPNLPTNPPQRWGPEFDLGLRRAFDTIPQIYTVIPNSGSVSGGTSVTLTGLNFRNLSDGTSPAILFGGNLGTSVVVVDPNTITVVTPAASNSGLVDVTISVGGQTFVFAGGFTYFEPSLVSASPSHGPFGGGTRVLISGYNIPSDSLVFFN